MIDANATVLVTGATGFTGSVLVRRLAETGCTVRAIARPSSDRSALDDLPVDWHTGDVFDPATVDAAIAGVDYVFHVAAAYRSAGITDETYRKVHVDSTRLLAQAAVDRAPDLQRFVHFSTVGVHGHIDNPPADEDAPYKPGDIYQDTKHEGEQLIRRFAAENSLPLTVIRPAAILGPADDRLLKLFKMAKLPVVPIIGRSKGMYHLIHVEDLVAFAQFAADSEHALGNVYICGNEHPTSIREIIATVAAELGTTPRFIRLPAWPIFAIARGCEIVCKGIGVEPPIYPRRVAFFTKDRAFDTAKMRGVPGFELRFDNKTGIVDTLHGYQNAGRL